MTLKLGLFSMTTGPCTYPDGRGPRGARGGGGRLRVALGRRARGAARPAGAAVAVAPEDRILDPVVALAFVAAHTTRIRLGTGIIILPQRNPAGAREGARLARRALGRAPDLRGRRRLPGARVPRARHPVRAPRPGHRRLPRRAARDLERGEARLSRALRALRRGGGAPAARAAARPAARGRRAHRAAFRRAVAQGHGWYGFALDEGGGSGAWRACGRRPRGTSGPPRWARSRSASRRARPGAARRWTARPRSASPRSGSTA